MADALTEASFRLHSIELCRTEEGEEASSSPSVTPALFSPTLVCLDVGHEERDNGRAPLRYRCPAFIVQRGSTTLRDILQDALDTTGAEAKDSEKGDGPLVIPLPFLERWAFEVVAVYWEHFFGLPCWSTPTAEEEEADGVEGERRVSASTPSLASSAAARGAEWGHRCLAPSVLRRPLNLADLYALSSWEHHFVVHCLLGLPWSQIMALELVRDGRWVDVVAGGPAYRSAGETSAAVSLRFAECGSLVSRQQMWTRLMGVLEASTRLGVWPLQLLCASVAADMTMDLDAEGLGQLMKGEAAAGQRVVPPFTAEARAHLIQRFPWLAREQSKGSLQLQP